MQKVEKGLYDANGNLETLPSQLYGARRKNLTTIRDSNALTQEASDAKTARYQLGQVLYPRWIRSSVKVQMDTRMFIYRNGRIIHV